MLSRPAASDFAEFQAGYIGLCPDDILPFLKKQSSTFTSFIENLDAQKLDFRYAPEKWSLREVIIHIIDTEVIFDYRCLAALRDEPAALPGFDQDIYIKGKDFSHLDKDYLSRTFKAIRSYSLCLFEGFQDSDWHKQAKMSYYSMSLNVMPFMLGGHLQHHMNIIQERYL